MTGFAYFALLGRSGAGPPAGLAAADDSRPGGQAVLWDHVERAWRAGSAGAVPVLSEPRFATRRVPVPRAEAERIAREYLNAELPSERELRRIIDEPAPRAPGSGTEPGGELDNEDWLRARSWNLPAGDLTRLWFVLGLPPDASEEQRRAALREFVRLPVWQSAPPELRREAETYLSGGGAAVQDR